MTGLETLPRSFFVPSAREVAPALLGHLLLRRTPAGPAGGPIVETEAYLADDPACHGYIGPTPRNRALFGEPGHAYVYFIYGCHFCINAVCRPAGQGEAVLIRAIEASLGVEQMRRNRHVKNTHSLSNGPGKLCQSLAITRALDCRDLCDAASPVYIAKNPSLPGFLAEHGPVISTPRIGITQAASLPLRFYLPGSQFLSRRHSAPA